MNRGSNFPNPFGTTNSEGCEEFAPDTAFAIGTGTRSIPQIGHFPGVRECTEGCMAQVQ